jgi:hypothetical protein
MPLEEILRQVEGARPQRQHLLAERDHRVLVFDQHLAEAGQVGRPGVELAERLAGEPVRIVGRALAADDEGFVERGFGLLDEILVADLLLVLDLEIARLAVLRDFALFLDRQVEEALGLAEHAVEQLLLHAMSGQIEEADRLGHMAQFPRDALGLARLAGEIAGDVDRRNLLCRVRMVHQANEFRIVGRLDQCDGGGCGHGTPPEGSDRLGISLDQLVYDSSP